MTCAPPAPPPPLPAPTHHRLRAAQEEASSRPSPSRPCDVVCCWDNIDASLLARLNRRRQFCCLCRPESDIHFHHSVHLSCSDVAFFWVYVLASGTMQMGGGCGGLGKEDNGLPCGADDHSPGVVVLVGARVWRASLACAALTTVGSCLQLLRRPDPPDGDSPSSFFSDPPSYPRTHPPTHPFQAPTHTHTHAPTTASPVHHRLFVPSRPSPLREKCSQNARLPGDE
jgi:hypothetical protein